MKLLSHFKSILGALAVTLFCLGCFAGPPSKPMAHAKLSKKQKDEFGKLYKDAFSFYSKGKPSDCLKNIKTLHKYVDGDTDVLALEQKCKDEARLPANLSKTDKAKTDKLFAKAQTHLNANEPLECLVAIKEIYKIMSKDKDVEKLRKNCQKKMK